MIEAVRRARVAIEKVLGKRIHEETLTTFEARLLASVSTEIEKAITLERQGVAQIVLTALERAKLAETTNQRDEWPGAIRVLDEVRSKIDRRSVTDETLIAGLAASIGRVMGESLAAFNAIADTDYSSFEEAARELALGQAPMRLEDDQRIWPVLAEAWKAA
jgi:hypothetical protein